MPATAFIDPFAANTTLSLACDVIDPITREVYDRDPRGIAKKAEAYLKSTGIADTAFFGPEAEFFIFDGVSYDTTSNSSYYHLDSIEGIWNRGKEKEENGSANLGYKIRHKEGYFPVAPADKLIDIRNEMILTMIALGHHDRARAPRGGHRRPGRNRHRVRHAAADVGQDVPLQVRRAKTSPTSTARPPRSCRSPSSATTAPACTPTSRCGRTASPSSPATATPGLSEMALYYIGGILKHAPALCAICNPTNNSYKRLVPGYEAPVNLAYSARNRSASIRIPTYSPSPKAKRIEYRTPDPAANPYLANAAMLMAGLDGILNKIHPGEPLDKNLYDLPPEEKAKVPHVPDSLKGAIEALEADHAFLLKGDVFSQDFLDNLHRDEDAANTTPCACARTLRVPPLLRRLIEAGTQGASHARHPFQTGCRQAAGFVLPPRRR